MKSFKWLLLVFCFGLCGCAVVDLFKPEVRPYDSVIFDDYNSVELKVSSAADVLSVIHIAGEETISQSKSVIGSVGEKKAGYKVWLKMVSFDEDELTANRKYVFIEDEKPKALFVDPWGSFKFGCQMFLGSDVLDEPYSNENARRISILRRAMENTRKDIDSIGSDNKQIAICGMLINQSIEAVLIKLESSPALAMKMSEAEGLDFGHISYDKGKIKMKVSDDIVDIKIRLGSIVKKRVGVPDSSFKE